MKNSDIRKGLLRNKFVYSFLGLLIGWIIVLIRNFSYKRYKVKNKPVLILANHNSDFDPLLMVIHLKTHFKFVASANILSGFVGKIINFLSGPIPRAKGASADDTVKAIIANLNAGINVAMFPEGNKSWDGETCFISPRTATILKETDCALLTYRFDGGYLRSPRWAVNKRKGKVFGTVVNEYSHEQLAEMSVDEIYKVICDDLYVDAFEYQQQHMQKYTGKALAEGFENMAFICPKCHNFDTIKTEGNMITCSCGHKVKYNEYGFLENEEDSIVNTSLKWNKFQKEYLLANASRLKERTKDFFSSDQGCQFYVVKGEDDKVIVFRDAIVRVYGDRITVSGKENNELFTFYWHRISKMGMFRSTCLFFTHNDKRYEIRKAASFSCLKYFFLWRTLTGKTLV